MQSNAYTILPFSQIQYREQKRKGGIYIYVCMYIKQLWKETQKKKIAFGCQWEGELCGWGASCTIFPFVPSESCKSILYSKLPCPWAARSQNRWTNVQRGRAHLNYLTGFSMEVKKKKKKLNKYLVLRQRKYNRQGQSSSYFGQHFCGARDSPGPQRAGVFRSRLRPLTSQR